MNTTEFLQNQWKWVFSDLENRIIYKKQSDNQIIKIDTEIIEDIKNITSDILKQRTDHLLKLIENDLEENPNAFEILDLDQDKAKKKFSRTEFSNIYPVEVYYEWKTWPSNEHAYMYKKFNFKELREYFSNNLDEFNSIKDELYSRFLKSKWFTEIDYDDIFTIDNIEKLYSDERITWYFLKVLSKKFEELDLRIPEWESIKL